MWWSTIVVAGAVELGGEQLLGERHADRVGEALAERAGGRLDARRDADLGMARRLAVQLAEVAQLVDRQVVAGEVQQRVEQHRAVAVARARSGRGRASAGCAGLWRRCRPHSATAISAMPIGAPGWPELACCTASIASARIALAISVVACAVGVAIAASGDAEAVRGNDRGHAESPVAARGACHFTGRPAARTRRRIIAPMQGLHLTADLRGCAAGRAGDDRCRRPAPTLPRRGRRAPA